ncbi:putative antibiotic resistance protein [Aliivibrio wodanis]|uniref:Putative antibiotic resistance protein n=1 Tax=Aliivibrio wodanis TaxID=80852 RepID=A0A090ILM5_9GAMM|nr:putative antibiotic resistance protein [Aliivibrio wodanis]
MSLNTLKLDLIHVEPLTGGLTNACLKVEAQEGTFVWRPVSEQATLLGADRDKERDILTALDAVSFAPKVYDSDGEGLLVEWFDGEVIALDKAQQVAIELLASVHQLTTNGFDDELANDVMSLKLRILSYWSSLEPENQTNEMHAYVDYFSQKDERPLFEPCLCHFDIGAYNIIVKEQGYGLIDWEYASIGDPSQDLATMIIANQFDVDEVIHSYCMQRDLDDNEWKYAVKYWTPWVCFMGALWFSLGYQLLKDSCYQELAEREMNKLKKLLPLIKK